LSESSSAAGSTDSQIEAALREYLERIDRGEVLDREEFLSQHSAIADRLRSLIEAEEILRKMGETGRAPHRGDAPTQSFTLHAQDTIAPQGCAGRTAEERESSLPKEFGRYKLLRILGQGAMGTVYLAEDTQLQRQVALKTPQFEKDPTPELLERFYREARAAACLRHPNTCPVHDVGQIDGTHYITMAYIEGHPLSAFVGPDKPQPERQVLIVVRKLAQALQEAHEHGIVHRDLKPSNIIIDTRNEPVIMDFGLARRVRSNDNIKLTQDGMLIGTPAYMSPEQVDGEPGKVGPATDQYSLGVILYELLTGTLPFRGSITGVLGQILTKEVPPPSQFRPDLDPRIEAVCLRMLAKNPAERFGSLEAVAEELATILRAPRTKPRGDDPARSGTHASQSEHHAAVRRAGELHPATSGVLRPSKPLTPNDLASLEELAHKCIARHDYDQVVQIVEHIPEEQRTAPLTSMLERARSKADEIAFLICEIDEAVRFENRATAIRKARELLAIKPGHHRALEVLEQSAEPEQEEEQEEQEEVAPVHRTHHSTKRSRRESWIPWAALAFGLAVFALVSGGIFVYLNRSANSQDAAEQSEPQDVIEPQVAKKNPEVARQHAAPNEAAVASVAATKKGPVPAARPDPTIVRGDSPPSITNNADPGLPHAASPSAAAPAKADASMADTDGKPDSFPVLVAPFDEATAKKAQQDWSERLETPVDVTDSAGIVLRLVAPGEFQMGTNDPHREEEKDAKPAHRVRITRPFYLAIHEVTRGQFAQFVTATRFKTKAETDSWGSRPTKSDTWSRREHARFAWHHPGFPQDDSHPVVDVTWDDAQEFCNWLSRKEGKRYRLPREAEWEYAARAGTTGVYGPGDNREDLPRIANVVDAAATAKFPAWKEAVTTSDGFVYTSPVGTFPPNHFGLYDTLGNAMEWCEDWYDENYYAGSPQNDPLGPTRGKQRVARGGSFSEHAPVYNRWNIDHDAHLFFLGFRVVRDVLSDSSNEKPETAAAPADDQRRLWKGSQSSFENIRPGFWHASVTIFKKRIDAEFSEMSRTQRAVYLIDRTRGTDVRIRLTNEQAFCYTPGKAAEYRPVDKGTWLSR
jgi:serine/threonine protein kinase/formylglycine-generating enzyme required for sulfatase activity